MSNTIEADESEGEGKVEDDNQSKDKVFTWNEFKSAVTAVDLTIDNWKNYFEIKEIEEISPVNCCLRQLDRAMP